MARGLGLPSLGDLISPSQLRELGWASAGGAAGFVGASFAMPLVEKLPLVSSLPKEAVQGLLGIVGARLAWNWNQDFAKGMAGGLAGHAAAKAVLRLVGGNLQLALSPGAPGDEEFAQLPSPDMPVSSTETDVVVDESELAEVEPSQSFRGFGASVEPEATISNVGSWIS